MIAAQFDGLAPGSPPFAADCHIEAQAIAVYVRSAPTFVALRTNARPETPDVPSSRRSP